MTNSTTDGLGYDELGQAGSQVASTYLTGSVITDSFFSGANVYGTTSVEGATVRGTTLSGGQLLLGGSALTTTSYSTAGSPYYQGTVINFTAETIITGGMWVSVSGAAGGASIKAKAAATSTTPVGVATATAASGATVSVLVRGLTYLTAEATISNSTQIRMGAGAALNTVAQATTGSGARGVALAGAGSEGVALVYLW